MIESTIFFAGVVVCTIYRVAKFCWMSWFDGTLMYYSTLPTEEMHGEPFEFEHQGTKYKVFVRHEKIKNRMLGTKLSRSNVYIDDNLVLMISRMRCTVFVKRSIDVDLKYVNGDIFKILKWARKYWNEKFDGNCIREFESVKLIKN